MNSRFDGNVLTLGSYEENGNIANANMVITATDAAIEKGAHAGNMIKELAALIGGGGGGRPNMAQAGGKDPSGADEAVKKAAEVLEGQLK